MARAEPDVTFHETGDIHVIRILGALVDRVSVQNVARKITAQLDPTTAPKVVICFDEVKEVSSAILGAVLKIDKQVRLKNGHLRLAGLRPNVHGVFQLTRLNTILDIHDSTEDAVSNFD